MDNQAAVKLDNEVLREIASFVVGQYREEEAKAVKTRYNRRRANTRLLLRNYRSLVDHCDSATYTTSQVDAGDGYCLAEIIELINGSVSERFDVESIRQSAVKTRIIIEHVDAMINLYKTYCDKSPKEEDRRRYRVIYWLYLDYEPKTAFELAGMEHVDERTIYRDVTAAVEQLTAFFFGVGGINLLVK